MKFDIYTFLGAIPLFLFMSGIGIACICFSLDVISDYRYNRDIKRKARETRRMLTDPRIARKESEAMADPYLLLTPEQQKVWDDYDQAKDEGTIR